MVYLLFSREAKTGLPKYTCYLPLTHFIPQLSHRVEHDVNRTSTTYYPNMALPIPYEFQCGICIGRPCSVVRLPR